MTGNRTTRGRGRLVSHPTHDIITLCIPLTAAGVIDDDDATAILRILLLYSPHLAQRPAHFRTLLAAALLSIAHDPTP